MLVKPRSNIHDPLPDGRTNPSISVDKLYVVTSIVLDDFRIVDDNGEPILVPASCFETVDDWTPDNWTQESDNEGWYWRGPPQCAARGFFERWHDGNAHERRVFAEVYSQLWRYHESHLKDQKLALKR
jgi:hypothetical protein